MNNMFDWNSKINWDIKIVWIPQQKSINHRNTIPYKCICSIPRIVIRILRR